MRKMQTDDPELPCKALSMFRNGYDTYAMSITMGVDECVIERNLHKAMAAERQKVHTQADGEIR